MDETVNISEHLKCESGGALKYFARTSLLHATCKWRNHGSVPSRNANWIYVLESFELVSNQPSTNSVTKCRQNQSHRQTTIASFHGMDSQALRQRKSQRARQSKSLSQTSTMQDTEKLRLKHRRCERIKHPCPACNPHVMSPPSPSSPCRMCPPRSVVNSHPAVMGERSGYMGGPEVVPHIREHLKFIKSFKVLGSLEPPSPYRDHAQAAGRLSCSHLSSA